MQRPKPVALDTINNRQLREELAVLTLSDIKRGDLKDTSAKTFDQIVGYTALGAFIGGILAAIGFGIFIGFVALFDTKTVADFVSVGVHTLWMIVVVAHFASVESKRRRGRAEVDRRVRVQSSLLRSVLSMCPDGSKVHVPEPIDVERVVKYSSGWSGPKHLPVGWSVTIAAHDERPQMTLSLCADARDVWTMTLESDGALPRRIWDLLAQEREVGRCWVYGAGKRRLEGELGAYTKIRSVEVVLGEWSSWSCEGETDRDVLQAALLSLEPVGALLRVVCPRLVRYAEHGRVSVWDPSGVGGEAPLWVAEEQPRVLVSHGALREAKAGRDVFERVQGMNREAWKHRRMLVRCVGAFGGLMVVVFFAVVMFGGFGDLGLYANSSASLAVGMFLMCIWIPEKRRNQSYEAHDDTVLDVVKQEVVLDGSVVRLGDAYVELSRPFQETYTRDPEEDHEGTGVVALTLRQSRGGRVERVTLRVRVERSAWLESLPLLQTRGLLVDGEEFDRWIAPALVHFRSVHGADEVGRGVAALAQHGVGVG